MCHQSGTWLSRDRHNIFWLGSSQHFSYLPIQTWLSGTIITFSGRGCLKNFLTFLYRFESMSHVSPVWHLAMWGPSEHFLDGVVSTIFLTIIFRRESMCLTCHYSGTWLSGAITTFSGQCLSLSPSFFQT